MHKRAFQALTRTFLHVSGLLSTYFDNKKPIYEAIVFYQIILGEDLRHAKTCLLGTERHVYACLRSSPTIL